MTTDSLKATEAYSAARATHPRVTLADLEQNMGDVFYMTGAQAVAGAHPIPAHSIDMPESLKLLTICLVVCKNGFTIIGKSAPASPENFDPEKGKTFAYEDAVRQLWPLMGYELRQRLSSDPR